MALGKFVAKLAKKDKSGYTKRVVEEEEANQRVIRMKKDQLEETAKKGTKDEKYYAKLELERRAGNKEMVKELKDRQKKFPGLMSDKSLKNRIKANKQKTQTSDDIRDSILNEYERATGTGDMARRDEFRKGGMVKKVAVKKPTVKVPSVKKVAVKKVTAKKK